MTHDDSSRGDSAPGESCAGSLAGLPDQGVIPRAFHSDYSGEPFRRCLVCEDGLLDGRLYQIQKSVRGTECTMEMALCLGCLQEMQSQFSDSSRQTLARYQARSQKIYASVPYGEHCEFCPSDPAFLPNYSVAVMCRRSALVVSPMYVCELCEDEIQQSLSEETRGFYDDFLQQHFPGLPAELDLNLLLPAGP